MRLKLKYYKPYVLTSVLGGRDCYGTPQFPSLVHSFAVIVPKAVEEEGLTEIDLVPNRIYNKQDFYNLDMWAVDARKPIPGLIVQRDEGIFMNNLMMSGEEYVEPSGPMYYIRPTPNPTPGPVPDNYYNYKTD